MVMAARILIPVDNQECTSAAIKSVMLRTWPEDTQFLLLKVVEDFSGLLYANEVQHSTALSAEQEEYTYEMRMWLNEQTDAFSKVFPNTESRLEIGRVSQRICEVACEWLADYIIIGSHDRQRSSRCALGSVASEVMSIAPCSVEAVRFKQLHHLLMQDGKITEEDIEEIVSPPSKIMVAVDLTKESEVITDWVGSIGWPKDAEIRLITVEQSPHREEISLWHRGIGTLYTREGQHQKVVESNLHTLVEKLAQVCSNKIDSQVIRHEVPSEGILEAANEWEAGYLVVGASGQKAGYEMKSNSTPLSVIAGLHCSIAIMLTNGEKLPTFKWN